MEEGSVYFSISNNGPLKLCELQSLHIFEFVRTPSFNHQVRDE